MNRLKLLLLSNRIQVEAVTSWWWHKTLPGAYGGAPQFWGSDIKYPAPVVPRIKAFEDLLHRTRGKGDD